MTWIPQKHMGDITLKPKNRLEKRFPVRAKVTKVYPAQIGAEHPVTVDCIELPPSNHTHNGVEVFSHTPRGGEVPREGDICLLIFEKGDDLSPIIIGWAMGKQIPMEVTLPSEEGEIRKVHESGSFDIMTQDGSQSIRRINELTIHVLDPELLVDES